MNTQKNTIIKALLISLFFNLGFAEISLAAQSINAVRYKTVNIEGLDIFYCEAGNPKHPIILLLHGFPISSHMFRDLISEKYGELS